MKINNVKHAQLSPDEMFQFFTQFVIIINKYGAAKMKISAVFNLFVPLLEGLKNAIDKEQGNILTGLLIELDRKRDILISAFIKWLEAMTDFPDAAMAANAVKFLHFVNGYGNGISRKTDWAETTILSQIVEGFTTNDSRKKILATMNGSAWIVAINEVNNEFQDNYSKRVGENASNKKVVNFTSLRKPIVDSYTNVNDVLIGRLRSDKEDGLDVSTYENCITEINELVGKANLIGSISKPNGNDPKPGEGNNPI